MNAAHTWRDTRLSHYFSASNGSRSHTGVHTRGGQEKSDLLERHEVTQYYENYMLDRLMGGVMFSMCHLVQSEFTVKRKTLITVLLYE